MQRFTILLAFLVLVILAWRVERASACPLCKEAVENSGTEEPQDDPLREGRAWNQSIYLMVSMPYLLLGGLGLLIYREHRKKARAADSAVGNRGAGGVEDTSCSGHTRDETS